MSSVSVTSVAPRNTVVVDRNDIARSLTGSRRISGTAILAVGPAGYRRDGAGRAASSSYIAASFVSPDLSASSCSHAKRWRRHLVKIKILGASPSGWMRGRRPNLYRPLAERRGKELSPRATRFGAEN